MEGSFRPLSRGSFFNTPNKAEITKALKVFAPFSGTFFNDGDFALMAWVHEFSSPFLGTFFQYVTTTVLVIPVDGFRPLSWGLSFNYYTDCTITKTIGFVFVPFLGDFL